MTVNNLSEDLFQGLSMLRKSPDCAAGPRQASALKFPEIIRPFSDAVAVAHCRSNLDYQNPFPALVSQDFTSLA